MWLIHSAKGTTWKDHKYIAIKNGKYIYDTAKKKTKYGAVYSKGWLKEKLIYDRMYKKYDPNGQYFGRSRSTDMGLGNGAFQINSGSAGASQQKGLKAAREREGINTANRKKGQSAPQQTGRKGGYKTTDRTGEAAKKRKAIKKLRRYMYKKVKDL